MCGGQHAALSRFALRWSSLLPASGRFPHESLFDIAALLTEPLLGFEDEIRVEALGDNANRERIAGLQRATLVSCRWICERNAHLEARTDDTGDAPLARSAPSNKPVGPGAVNE
jgi:hypothetical protein